VIVSISRRTDVPAFYTPWLMNRVRAGWCEVVNPFNPNQVRTVSLRPDDVDVLVFWTRFSAPLQPHLQDLEARGFRIVFLYTLTGYSISIEPGLPTLDRLLPDFITLSDRIGPDRIAWRYDPVLLTSLMTPEWHRDHFAGLAKRLAGHTYRVITSRTDFYRKTRSRLAEVTDQTILEAERDESGELLTDLTRIALDHGMTLQTCAESGSWARQAGKCIDDRWLNTLWNLSLSSTADPGQRKACHCIKSVDIGAYNSCLFGCRYCYATSSPERAWQIYKAHDPTVPQL
jgi:hypothetical protein